MKVQALKVKRVKAGAEKDRRFGETAPTDHRTASHKRYED